jgi:hypothetical protein
MFEVTGICNKILMFLKIYEKYSVQHENKNPLFEHSDNFMAYQNLSIPRTKSEQTSFSTIHITQDVRILS